MTRLLDVVGRVTLSKILAILFTDPRQESWHLVKHFSAMTRASPNYLTHPAILHLCNSVESAAAVDLEAMDALLLSLGCRKDDSCKIAQTTNPDWTWLSELQPAFASVIDNAVLDAERMNLLSGTNIDFFSCSVPTNPMAEGIDIIARTAPHLWMDMKTVVRYLVGFSHPQISAFSSGSAPGMIFVNNKYDSAMWYAENFVHEYAHSKMTLMSIICPIISQASSSSYDSPWRLDKRPIWGLFQGAFAYWHVLIFLVQAEVGVEILAEHAQSVRKAVLEIDAHGALTPFGKSLLQRILKSTEEVLSVASGRC